jgi:DNA (cytosine-5)-methyltransferase 1
MTGLLVDNFAGGGGASTGIEAALGRAVDIAINHDAEALRMHEANHPATKHVRNNIWQVDPCEVTDGQPVELAWFSPDCKHFSKAKGGKPREKSIRDLAWVVVLWAQRVKPTCIFLENVEEFRTWGPLDDHGQIIRDRVGETFTKWCKALRRQGYKLQFRELRACDYGAPTIRKRFFMIARCDGQPIVWPAPTHGKPDSAEVLSGQRLPWRTAAEIIDWSIPCPSIFERKKPLAEKTLRRIAHGIVKFVLKNPHPFIVPVCNTKWAGDRYHPGDEPLRTITTAKGGELALVAATIERQFGKSEGSPVDAPLPTTTSGGGGKSAVVQAFMQKFADNGKGYSPDEPLHTVMAGAPRHAVVAAHLAQFSETREGRKLNEGHSPEEPVSTIVQKGPLQAVCTSNLVKLRGTCQHGQQVDEPLATVSAQGTHMAEVRAFLLKYYGNESEGHDPERSLGTVTTKDRFSVVTVTIDGEEYVIVDIGMRMLTPRELFNAQGFPADYIIDRGVDGRPITKTAQVAKCGNSVCPPLAEALVAANAPSAAAARESVAA